MSETDPQPAVPKPIRRYRFTADRVVIGLLVVECLLWLSERFGWLAWHKGYAVLTAVAGVGVAMLVMLVWFSVALLFHRRFQFSIRSLLVLVVVVAVPCTWMAVEMKIARKQREAVEAIRAADGDIVYDWEYFDSHPRTAEEWMEWFTRKPPVPEGFTNWLGDDWFYDIAEVHFPGGWRYTADRCNDDTLRHIRCLTKLKNLKLTMTKVTYDGVKSVQEALPHCKIEWDHHETGAAQ